MTNLKQQNRRRISVRKAITASSALKFPTVKTLRSKIRSSLDQATTTTYSQKRPPVNSVKWVTLLVSRSSVRAPHLAATRTLILSWARPQEVTFGRMSSMLLSPSKPTSRTPVHNNTSLIRKRVMISRAAFSRKKLFRWHLISKKNVIATRVLKRLTQALVLISISTTLTILLSARAWPRSARTAHLPSHRASSLESLVLIRSVIRTAGSMW